jgi:hypothetical protein
VKKPFFVGFLCLVIAGESRASSLAVTEDIAASVAWGVDTVFIDKEYFEVKEGARLTLAPGTHVVFRKAISEITVRGTITAIGTPADSIFISRLNPDDIWMGIRLVPRNRPATARDSSFLEYCGLRNAGLFSTDTLYERQGGIFHCGTGNAARMSHCSVQNVQGYYGGAVYGDSGSTLIIDQCFFANNRTQTNGRFYGGGAIMTSEKGGAELLVRDCRFERNCSRNGGAVRIGKGTKATFDNCVFYYDTTYSINPNAEELNGGAVAVSGPADVTFHGCIMFYCCSYGRGGAIYSADASIKLINCTIANNTAIQGGGIYFGKVAAASSPLLVNTIEGGNGTSTRLPRDSAGCGIFLDSSVTPVFRYCQFYDTVNDVTIKPYSGEFTGSRYYRTDFLGSTPGFNLSDTTVEGYQLYSRFNKNDPAIDGGTPDTIGLGLPALDVLGQPRIKNAAVDIGAIEFQAQVGVRPVARAGARLVSGAAPRGASAYSLTGRRFGQAIGETKRSNGLYLFKTQQSGGQSRPKKVLVK